MVKWFFILLLTVNFSFAQKQPIDSLQQLRRQFESQKDFKSDTNYLKLQNNIAFNYWSSKPDSTILLSELNLELCRKAGFLKGLVDAKKNIGVAYWVKGDYDQALHNYQSALLQAEKINYKKGIGRLLLNISLIYSDQGKYPDALDNNFRSLKICESIGDKKGLALNYNNMAIIYYNQGKFSEALKNYFNSLKISEQMGNRQDVAMATSNIAELYLRQKKYPEALDFYARSLKLKEEVRDQVGVATNLGGIGEIYKLQGNYESALEYYFKAWTIQQTIGNKPDMAVLLEGIGDCYYYLKQYEKASTYCKQGLEIANTIGHKKFIRDGNEILSKIYKALNQYDKALVHYEKFKQYSDSIINQESQQKTSVLEAQYLFDKKEIELKSEQAKKDAEYERQATRQQMWIYVFAIGLFSVVVLSLILLRNNRSKRIANLLLQQKNTEIISQKEKLESMDSFKNRLLSVVSHDVRGPLNSLKGMFFLFEQKAITEEETKDMIAKIGVKVGQVNGFVDDLLQWAKNQMTNPEIKPSRFHIADAALRTIDLLISTANAKHINIIKNLAYSPEVLADEEMIKIVIRNLVSNAIKFCKENDTIEITTEPGVEKTNTVIISVKDSGAGMSPEKIEKLFVSPYLSTKGTDNEIGTGLGLMLCKQYIELNKGMISAESSMGKGSRFWVTLPLPG